MHPCKENVSASLRSSVEFEDMEFNILQKARENCKYIQQLIQKPNQTSVRKKTSASLATSKGEILPLIFFKGPWATSRMKKSVFRDPEILSLQHHSKVYCDIIRNSWPQHLANQTF